MKEIRNSPANMKEYKYIDTVLIIEEFDEIPQNYKYFIGKRFDWLFIHKDNKYKENFKKLLEPNLTVNGFMYNQINEYY